jgi:FlaA1/EpsC-like NDP-sugar epimerase
VIVDACDDPVTVVSRCELRQKEMQKSFPDFEYVVGDVTNRDWEEQLPSKVRHVFNLAAMKHVDIGESNVRRCIDINYFGVVNTYKYAEAADAESYSFSSTDKAVLPVNTYGLAKALGEKYLYERIEKNYARPKVSIFRWGNVLGSRGSVFHKMAATIKGEGKAYVTHKDMTRFWIHIDDVARFMWENRGNESAKRPHIPDMKATSVVRLAHAIAEATGCDVPDIVYTGIRPGEKIHECLYTSHDYCLTSNTCDQFTDKELVELVHEVLDDSFAGRKGRHGKALPGSLKLPEHPVHRR